MQKRDMREVRELIRLKSIRLSVSDKDGDFVVIPHQLDVETRKNHLEDDSLYGTPSEKDFKSIYRKLNHEWVKMVKNAGLKLSVSSQLKVYLPTFSVLYLLIKTHMLVSSDNLASTDPSFKPNKLYISTPFQSLKKAILPKRQPLLYFIVCFSTEFYHLPYQSSSTAMPPDSLPNCPGLSKPDRKRNEVASFFGTTRRGALFCRSGNWLEIIDERTSQLETRRGGIGDSVRGTRREGSRFSVLEFLSVAIGLVSIRGEVSQRYLCMDRDGKLYAAAPQNYTSECVFLEEMMENYYNLYSSCAHGTRKRPWYVALVSRLLAPSLKHQPPKDQSFIQRQNLAKTRIEQIQSRLENHGPTASTHLRRIRKRKRRRQQRLEREQRRRQQRQQELERLREQELSQKRRPK
uniref:Fibroblast growth factor n=1 Tax=Angiostrongylus cantonensis TaxID=6313 RepID=A0A158PA40_ANGCA